MDHRGVKSLLYEQIARIGKAVASSHRLEMLDLLSQGEKSVEDLAAAAGLSVKNASAHLRILRTARLVEVRKEARFSYYRLADRQVGEFFIGLRDLAEGRLAEMREVSREYFGGRKRMTRVDRKELMRRARRGEVTVIDVRPIDEYRAGHLPGARSIPLSKLRRSLDSIPRSREVVAYCRGPYCILAHQATELLRAEGYRATQIDDGVADWMASGLPVESGPPTEEKQRN